MCSRTCACSRTLCSLRSQFGDEAHNVRTTKKKMNRIHIAISTNNIAATIEDYTKRLGTDPCLVVDDEYALWRTETLNVSVRQDQNCQPGELRHLGWEDPSAMEFTKDSDANGIVWERFNAQQQADEINNTWPGADYVPEKK